MQWATCGTGLGQRFILEMVTPEMIDFVAFDDMFPQRGICHFKTAESVCFGVRQPSAPGVAVEPESVNDVAMQLALQFAIRVVLRNRTHELLGCTVCCSPVENITEQVGVCRGEKRRLAPGTRQSRKCIYKETAGLWGCRPSQKLQKRCVCRYRSSKPP